MLEPRVLVVRHVPEEALGRLQLELSACRVALEVADCFAADWPGRVARGFDPANYDGLVVMGGPMSANDAERFPHLAVELDWLRAATAAGLPTLGICLGAQLLAKALGGRVYRHQVPEIGWYSIELLPAAAEDPLLGQGIGHATVFHWHNDTFELPPGAVQLARSATCPQQAFRIGNVWGLQFHPEMTAAMADDWLVDPSLCSDVTPEAARQIVRQTPEALQRSIPFVEQIFRRFAALCHARPRARS